MLNSANATSTVARTLARSAAVVLAVVAGLLFTASPALAEPNSFTVSSLGDAPDANPGDGSCETAEAFVCTLRAAITEANATPNAPDGPDAIGFGVVGTIQLGSPLPSLSTDMAIVGTLAGSGTTVGRGLSGGAFRIFTVTGEASVLLKYLTLANGFATGGTSEFERSGGAVLMTHNSYVTIESSTIIGNQAAADGGAIYNHFGTLTVVDTLIHGNLAAGGDPGANAGGAIATGFFGTTTVTDSTLRQNRADFGGGLNSRGTLDVTNSTLTGNIADWRGGGIHNLGASGPARLTVANSTIHVNTAVTGDGGGIANFSVARVTNSTITGNAAPSGEGGGVFNRNLTLFRSTLVALNGASVGPDLRGTGASDSAFDSHGYNLIGNADGSEGIANGANGDQAGSTASPLDPKFPLNNHDGRPDLEDNGGPTETIRLLPGSPAIGRGSDAATDLVFDQRGAGFPRKVGAHVDVGAFEAPNQRPVNFVPGPQATPEDSPLVFASSADNPISLSDLDAGGPLTTTLFVSAGSGTLASGGTTAGVVVAGSGTARLILTGTASAINTALDGLTFAPAGEFNGATTLTVTSDDGDGSPGGALADTDAVEISVGTVNDAPVARDDHAAAAGVAVDIAVLANDSDADGDSLMVATASDPAHGTASIAPGGASVRYTPDAGHSGSDTFAYTASDGNGGTATATVTVTVDGDPAPRDVADTSAPAAPRITSPRSGAYDRDGSFAISGTAEPGAVVRVLERGGEKGTAGADAGGVWSIRLERVRDGAHSYTATATDSAGNASAASAPTTVTVDGVHPTVGPLRTRRHLPAAGGIVAVFSEAMDARSLTEGTVALRRRASATRVMATVRYLAATRRVALYPRGSLAPGASHVVTIRGGRAGATDLAGNPLKRTRTWSITVRQ